jgi:hypothetical protein
VRVIGSRNHEVLRILPVPRFHTPSHAFRLKLGESITGCYPILTHRSDHILEEVMNCHQCVRPAHQVIVVATSSGLHHRIYLCVHHFAEAAELSQSCNGNQIRFSSSGTGGPSPQSSAALGYHWPQQIPDSASNMTPGLSNTRMISGNCHGMWCYMNSQCSAKDIIP